MKSNDLNDTLKREATKKDFQIKQLQSENTVMQFDKEDSDVKFSNYTISINKKDKQIVILKKELKDLNEKFELYHKINEKRQADVQENSIINMQNEYNKKSLKFDSLLREVKSIIEKHNFPSDKNSVKRLKTIIAQSMKEDFF